MERCFLFFVFSQGVGRTACHATGGAPAAKSLEGTEPAARSGASSGDGGGEGTPTANRLAAGAAAAKEQRNRKVPRTTVLFLGTVLFWALCCFGHCFMSFLTMFCVLTMLVSWPCLQPRTVLDAARGSEVACRVGTEEGPVPAERGALQAGGNRLRFVPTAGVGEKQKSQVF